MRGKSLMFQGTGSSVGKSMLCAAVLRILKQDGLKAAPFKAQNMALNSYATSEGLEMGRAQVTQAEAAGVEPTVKMNPVLLKPTSDRRSQIIVGGKPIGTMSAMEYDKFKPQLRKMVKEIYDDLESSVDVVVIEGAGSPAEINLKEGDIVNMSMAKSANAPVILIGDINPGGVFASLYGTVKLLDADEQARMERAVREADCLIGAKRMLEAVDAPGKDRHVAVPAQDIVKHIRESAHRTFAVLLSGDTGFYSGAKGLLSELTDCEVEVLPGIGSLQYFCAKLQRPWQDVRPVSLHGRDCDFIREVQSNSAVFALVGGENGVQAALKRLSDANLGQLTVHVGERLGYPDEKITRGSADELVNVHFASLSVVLVENHRSGDFVVTHGLPDDAFDRDETPMTKSEVRAISLSKLQLTQEAVVYDVGSGSGSVSVECALQTLHGKVYAVEMKEKAIALTRRNAAKFHLTNLETICGCAPEALENLPAPTHAFIGGSTGSMRKIISFLLEKNPRVRIVVNTVTLETLAELTEIAKDFDFCDIAEVSISKPRKLGKYQLMTAQNPVFIFTLQNGVQT